MVRVRACGRMLGGRRDFVDLLGMFVKVVAVETRPPQLGSYVVDVEIPDGERRRGLPAHEFELVKS